MRKVDSGSEYRRSVDTSRTAAEIVAIRTAATEQERQRLLSAFITSRRVYFSQVAQRTRYSGIQSASPSGQHYDDIFSIVMEVAASLALEGFDLDAGYRFENVLQVRARSAIREYVESGAATGVSRMSGHRRRSRSVAVARSRLAQQLGREPTDDEVLAEQHRVASARKDAVKQGVLASSEDLTNFATVPTDDIENVAMFQAMSDFQMGAFASVETEAFVSSLVKECSADDKSLGDFAKAWIGAMMAGETLTSLLGRLGMSESRARRQINEIRRRAIQHLQA